MTSFHLRQVFFAALLLCCLAVSADQSCCTRAPSRWRCSSGRCASGLTGILPCGGNRPGLTRAGGPAARRYRPALLTLSSASLLLPVLGLFHLLFVPKNRRWWRPVILLGLAGPDSSCFQLRLTCCRGWKAQLPGSSFSRPVPCQPPELLAQFHPLPGQRDGLADIANVGAAARSSFCRSRSLIVILLHLPAHWAQGRRWLVPRRRLCHAAVTLHQPPTKCSGL